MKSMLVLILAAGCTTQPSKQLMSSFEKAQPKYSIEVRYLTSESSRCPTKIDPEKSYSEDDLITWANGCFSKKNSQALDELSVLIAEKNVRSPWGYYFMSLSAELAGANQKSLHLINMAINKTPNIAVLYFQRGRLYWQNSEELLAVKDFEKASKLDDKLVSAHLFLAQVYQRDDLKEKARAHWDAVRKLDPSNPLILAANKKEVKQ